MVDAEEPPFLNERPVTSAAFHWATELHGEQLRAVDCAPFILHPIEVGSLLSRIGVDDEVVAAGLLHDAVENTDVGVDDIRSQLGNRVADLIAVLTEDPSISEYSERKQKLRDAVAAGGSAAQAIYAADKVVKTRELRAQANNPARSLEDPDLSQRLDHYERSLRMLEAGSPDLLLVHQLAFELWALRTFPPHRPAVLESEVP